ncbi:hypothetical protein ISN44_As10g009930 [Arabidopsis suecica]|uniref:Retrotransposon gag domain-containing protein n=1 Tax=Arabidopsis suecica TaxID=45249 RepID=A0A8T1ZU10_ARASU|nr:hypothetical protein ISN44_As10g009930 [Arabidopsis suecica]
MELSADTMTALNKAMAEQIKASTEAATTKLNQQIEQLTTQFEQRFKDLQKEDGATDSDTSEPPSPGEALRIAKGKSHVGSHSKKARTRTARSPTGGRETVFNQGRQEGSRAERPQASRQRRGEYIAGHRVFNEDSQVEYSEEERDSTYSGRTMRRDRNRGNGRDYDPVRQQLKHIKIQYPPFHGTNDPEVYLDWERKMESKFLVQGTYELNKLKIAVSEFSGYALLWWEQLGITRQRQREPPVATWEQLIVQMRKSLRDDGTVGARYGCSLRITIGCGSAREVDDE